MSNQKITKQVDAVICDFCNKEIDTKSGNYCYHSLPQRDEKIIDSRKYNVTHFLFSWRRPRKSPVVGQDTVRYDFHAACFDSLMQEFLSTEEQSNG